MEVTLQGKPVTLKGNQVREGDRFPRFTVMKNDLTPVDSKAFCGIRVFLAVPSLDTGVCDMEVRSFNKKASELPNVSIYAVSMDLPFAQTRWCGAKGVYAVTTLSDYRDRSFGRATGTLIGELGLLTRAVFVVDPNGVVVYAEYLQEIGDHPDYDRIYARLTELIR